MQGPMLGHVQPTSVRVWARVAGEAEFSVLYSRSANFIDALETKSVRATPENDYCVEVEIEGLVPSSFYFYKALVNGQPLESSKESQGYPLLTAPAKTAPVRFSIAFGSGAKADRDNLQAIWLQVQNARPHAFFWLGDNEATEGLSPELQAEEYRVQRNVSFLQPLLRSIPQLATWDGALGGASRKSIQVFKNYWANPSYGTSENPGSYFTFNYGNVDFYFLDTYSYRDQKTSSLLGKAQMSWLTSQLANSHAPFKVLLSSSSWTDVKKDSLSTWTAFPEERAALFNYIKTSEIDGVLLVSGDNDQAEVKAIPLSEDGGYDLYELVSSPLAQDPRASFDEQAQSTISIHEPYAGSTNFGLLTFDMTEADPSFSFEVIDVFGESVLETLTVNASELANGVSSWHTKVDDPAAYAYKEEKSDKESIIF